MKIFNKKFNKQIVEIKCFVLWKIHCEQFSNDYTG